MRARVSRSATARATSARTPASAPPDASRQRAEDVDGGLHQAVVRQAARLVVASTFAVVGRRIKHGQRPARPSCECSPAARSRRSSFGSSRVPRRASKHDHRARPDLHRPPEVFRVRFQVSGTGATQLAAKVWKDGTAEPVSWLLQATDPTAVLQAPGSIGIWMYLSGTATQFPMVMSMDDFRGWSAGLDPQPTRPCGRAAHVAAAMHAWVSSCSFDPETRPAEIRTFSRGACSTRKSHCARWSGPRPASVMNAPRRRLQRGARRARGMATPFALDESGRDGCRASGSHADDRVDGS